MSTWKYAFNGTTIDFEWDNPIQMVGDERIPHFTAVLLELREVADLLSFEVKRELSPPTDYTYQFIDRGGKIWSQVIHFATEPHTISGAYDAWPEETVIEVHQRVRSECVALIIRYDIKKIKATWV